MARREWIVVAGVLAALPAGANPFLTGVVDVGPLLPWWVSVAALLVEVPFIRGLTGVGYARATYLALTANVLSYVLLGSLLALPYALLGMLPPASESFQPVPVAFVAPVVLVALAELAVWRGFLRRRCGRFGGVCLLCGNLLLVVPPLLWSVQGDIPALLTGHYVAPGDLSVWCGAVLAISAATALLEMTVVQWLTGAELRARGLAWMTVANLCGFFVVFAGYAQLPALQ